MGLCSSYHTHVRCDGEERSSGCFVWPCFRFQFFYREEKSPIPRSDSANIIASGNGWPPATTSAAEFCSFLCQAFYVSEFAECTPDKLLWPAENSRTLSHEIGNVMARTMMGAQGGPKPVASIKFLASSLGREDPETRPNGNKILATYGVAEHRPLSPDAHITEPLIPVTPRLKRHQLTVFVCPSRVLFFAASHVSIRAISSAPKRQHVLPVSMLNRLALPKRRMHAHYASTTSLAWSSLKLSLVCVCACVSSSVDVVA